MSLRIAIAALLLGLSSPAAALAQEDSSMAAPTHAPYRSALTPTVEWTGEPLVLPSPGTTTVPILMYMNEKHTRDGPSALDITGTTAGAVLGGAIGFGVGALSGLVIADESGGGLSTLADGLYTGIAVGTTLLTPLGAHVANGGQGELGIALLASAATLAASLGIAAAIDPRHLSDAVPAAAIIQIPVTVAVELATEPDP